MRPAAALLSTASILLLGVFVSATEPVNAVKVDPAQVSLVGANATWQLLISGTTSDNRTVDLTHAATYRSRDPKLALVTAEGIVSAKGNGQTTIEISAGELKTEVTVTVTLADEHRALNFENDIVPILGKFACNASGCHGKAEGQNGFKLSVFGFDPPADYRALTQEARGRRVFPAAPERSLLLRKASGGAPHGGGIRITPDRPEYETLRRWIAEGLPAGSTSDPTVKKIELTPRERQLGLGQTQQLRVVAEMTDGQRIDVTRLARYQSNHDVLASVTEEGLVTAGQNPGVVAVMASYMGQVDVLHVIVPRPEAVTDYPHVPEHNFIDGHVYRRLKQLNIVPAELCSDADFLRRVHLDLIGTLPTADEARRFLSDTRTNRRELLIDSLLQRPEFAAYWALKWSDLLRVDRLALGHKGAYEQYRWIRSAIAQEMPLDQFARAVVTADGPLSENPQGYMFKAVPQPGPAASAVSQVFLGVRIECAQCHHHPYDRWSQTDYFGMTAYFAQLQRKTTPFGEVLVATGDPVTKHPRTSEVITAHPLGEPMPAENVSGDRRVELAAWMTSPGNPFFAKNMANRVWAHMLGRGLVEPVDDVRATNPPSNPELLAGLAQHLVASKFDLKSLLKTIALSRTYQQSTTTNATNVRDEQNYSRALLKRMDAEVLLDALCQATGIQERYEGAQANTRAIELWDSQVDHYFLKLFGRPVRVTACDCERVSEPSVAQVLHLLNSQRVQEKLSHDGGSVARLVKEQSQDDRLAEELYLTIFSRQPTAEESQTAVNYLQTAGKAGPAARRTAAEDLAWTMLNSLEFVFNH
ncbi:Bacterial Ig-like domain (group 2) [Anatilimnocola aggregata]|uniref:Bacterial Ig-like domain (Group 2) n=1 Tax=Anatilimnocola aggregata TaxID=2528021 RepID=A0A517YMG2_9BACT|nr:DUF1553 domain-containing protein [Anatilimnocola aggregata]QDU31417.1 Bacterial Ig-like domain (group 2) [Anatilimnocola aggregata]